MSCGKGCLGCAAAFFGVPLLFGAFTIAKCAWNDIANRRDKWLERRAREAEQETLRQNEARRIAEAKRIREAEIAEVEQKRLAKADKIRTFAIKDAPKVWDVYQSLKSDIDVQNEKIEELRKALVAFGRPPEQDEDFRRICALRDEMIRSQKALYSKLEEAYIAAKKYEASPSRKDYQELHKKALEDGILEADAAAAKFKEMRLNK